LAREWVRWVWRRPFGPAREKEVARSSVRESSADQYAVVTTQLLEAAATAAFEEISKTKEQGGAGWEAALSRTQSLDPRTAQALRNAFAHRTIEPDVLQSMILERLQSPGRRLLVPGASEVPGVF